MLSLAEHSYHCVYTLFYRKLRGSVKYWTDYIQKIARDAIRDWKGNTYKVQLEALAKFNMEKKTRYVAEWFLCRRWHIIAWFQKTKQEFMDLNSKEIDFVWLSEKCLMVRTAFKDGGRLLDHLTEILLVFLH